MKNYRKKISKQDFKNKLFHYNEFTQTISIIRFHWRFQRQTSIISSFRLFITITTNQKHQNDWKRKRKLSRIFTREKFLIFIHRKTIRMQRFRLRYSRFEISKIEITTRYFENIRWFKEKSFWRLRDCLNAISFKIKNAIKNLRSIKLTKNQSKYIVSSTFDNANRQYINNTKNSILFHVQNVDFAKINFDNDTTNEWFDYFESISHNSENFNKQ